MGMIVEFFAVPDTATETGDSMPFGTMVGSFSVNSHMVAVFLDALATTDLAGLIGDGSDSSRSLTLPSAKLSTLLIQIAPWSSAGSEMLIDAQIALEDAVAEVLWLNRALFVAVT